MRSATALSFNISRRALLGSAAALALVEVPQARLAAAQPASGEITGAERSTMAGIATVFLKEQGVPGLAVVIAHDGQVVYEAGFGLADKQMGEKVTPMHLFRIASISKPLTSVAVFTLIEQGRLKLVDKVFGAGGVLKTDYGEPPYHPFVEDLTIEHMLAHTGGWPKDAPDPMFFHPQLSLAELISWTIENTPPTTTPGKAYVYSNFGYCLLGRVIEKITKQNYDHYVRDAVLKRCGITDMRIAGNTLAERAAGEVVYYPQGDGDPYSLNVARMDSHGGWIAAAGDLVRFATHLETVLKPATIATMTTPSSANRFYAKGWSISGGGHWWHNGALAGASTILVRTKTGFSWAALANSRKGPPHQNDVVQALDKTVWNMVRAVEGWKA
jgi:CubicO group peptidase (beta-lactamase class C family)